MASKLICDDVKGEPTVQCGSQNPLKSTLNRSFLSGKRGAARKQRRSESGKTFICYQGRRAVRALEGEFSTRRVEARKGAEEISRRTIVFGSGMREAYESHRPCHWMTLQGAGWLRHRPPNSP